jgi:hypothetical protein
VAPYPRSYLLGEKSSTALSNITPMKGNPMEPLLDDEPRGRDARGAQLHRTALRVALAGEAGPLLQPGTPVSIRNGLEGRWSPGFTVVESSVLGYRVRRRRDGYLLRAVFPPHDIIPDRGSAAAG